jgi:uncharacterized protein YpmB
MNRLEWILGIMLALLLIIVAALALMFWFRADEPQMAIAPANAATEVAFYADKVEPTPVYAGQTAHFAYVTAEKTAVSWQPDAVLLNATATWPQGATEKALREGETTWGFTFYSPAAASMALISVLDNEANLVMQGAMPDAPQLLDVSGWRMDSTDVIDRLMDAGGAAFINQEGIAVLTMSLNLGSGNGRILWDIQLASPQSQDALIMSIDANSGEILEINQPT